MKTFQIKLSPTSFFHGYPASDTLFGAFCWGIKRIYDEKMLLTMLADFQNNPKFILSSSFPYVESKDDIHIPFYPKPMIKGLSAFDIDAMAKGKKAKVEIITCYKKFKKAEYITSSLFERFLKGATEKMLFEEFHKGNLEMHRNLLVENGYKNIFDTLLFKNEIVQKNSVDRITMSTGEEGQTFYQEEYFTRDNFKLHFFIKTDDIEFLKPVFRYLEDKGIGGNRSTGKGKFRIEIHNDNVSLSGSNSERFITLSRYIPDETEINIKSDAMFYEIFPYRSKFDSEEFREKENWKSRVMYLKEGSVLEATVKKPFYGRCPVVKEIGGQEIRQNGLAFPVFGNFGGIS